MGEESAIDQRLSAFAKVEEIGRCRIGGGAHGVAREGAIALLQVSLGSSFEVEFEPGRDACQEPAEGFEVSVFAAIGDVSGDGFDGHLALESAGGEIAEHGRGETVEDFEPVGAIVQRLRGCLGRGEGESRG